MAIEDDFYTSLSSPTPISCDEAIKLQCFKMALTSNQLNPLEFAKEIYAWVKECWIVKDKGATEITIEKNGETITIPLREFEVHA